MQIYAEVAHDESRGRGRGRYVNDYGPWFLMVVRVSGRRKPGSSCGEPPGVQLLRAIIELSEQLGRGVQRRVIISI